MHINNTDDIPSIIHLRVDFFTFMLINLEIFVIGLHFYTNLLLYTIYMDTNNLNNIRNILHLAVVLVLFSTLVHVCTNNVHIKYFGNTLSVLLWQLYFFFFFVTFVLLTPDLFVLETSDLTHLHLCTMHMHINTLGKILNILHVEAIFFLAVVFKLSSG